MAAKIIDGKAISAPIRGELTQEVAKLKAEKGVTPGLAVGLVGEDPASKITGNMFNNDEFGDYIIYAAWPGYKVFFDGRSDMYGVARMKEYIKVVRIEQGWDEVLKKYNINWIIYNAHSALSHLLLERDDWKLIYADKVANIFVRNTPENQSLIIKYMYVKPVKVEEKDDKED